MSTEITQLYGLEPALAESLRAAGCQTTRDLLEACRTPLDRRVLAVSTAQSEERILRWAQLAALYELPELEEFGVALLCEAGVTSVSELATASAQELLERFDKLHCLGGLYETLPTVETVEAWIDQARELPVPLDV